MNADYLRTLYDYNRWANGRVFETLAKLSQEQFTKDLATSFKSIHGALTHMISAEWIWLSRWKGASPKSMLTAQDYPNLDALKAKLQEIQKEQADLLNSLTDDKISGIVNYSNTEGKTFSFPLWQAMAHAANHSSYHRGQITGMLRQLGAKPVSTDMIMYFGMKTGQMK